MQSIQANAYEFIVDEAHLRRWCDAAARASFIALDTEFERQKTFFAELCLVQVATPSSLACIDPLAELDLAVLFECLAGAANEVIVHAARQDLEVLYFAGATLDLSLLDTQIAAALVGFTDQVGYAELVQQLLGVTLDKSQTRTNWRQRPLTARQLDYAADDVRYLGAVHEQLCQRLAARGRLRWLYEDCAELQDIAVIDPPLDNAWQRVKGLGNLDDVAFARAVALAAWREKQARERDLPRSWVLKDAQLTALAEYAPRDRHALGGVLAEHAGLVRHHADALLELIHGTTTTTAAIPSRPAMPSTAMRAAIKRFGARARALASDLDIAPSVLLTRRDMERVVSGDVPPRLQNGWRQEVLGELISEFASSCA